MDFTQLGKTLRTHGLRLERLTLPAGPVNVLWSHTGSIESLKDLTSLRSLTIPHLFLTGAQHREGTNGDHHNALDGYMPLHLEALLPSSLEILNLYFCHDGIKALDPDLVGVITSGRLNRLRRILMYRKKPLTLDLGPLGWIASGIKGGVILRKELNT